MERMLKSRQSRGVIVVFLQVMLLIVNRFHHG